VQRALIYVVSNKQGVFPSDSEVPSSDRYCQ